MGRPKKKQEEIAAESTEVVTEGVVQPTETVVEPVAENIDKAIEQEDISKIAHKKKVVKEKQPESKVTKKELTGFWKKETNPITFAVKYRCSNCGRYIIPDGEFSSKAIKKCIFCGSKNSIK